jgi:hypothetical protein
VPEKRKDQEYLGIFLPIGKKDDFKQYCEFVGSTMKDELEEFIDRCLADPEFQQYLEMKRKLQKKKEKP